MSRDFAFKDARPADPTAALQQQLSDAKAAYDAAQAQMAAMADLMSAGTPGAGDEEAWTGAVNRARFFPPNLGPGAKIP